MRLSFRIAIEEEVDGVVHAKCVNLKEAFVEEADFKTALSKMQETIVEKAQAYIQAGEKVPWERPKKRGSRGSDGANQVLWADLDNIEEDNLPPGNVIVTCISCGKKLHCEDVEDDNVPTIVHDGIICQSHGNYGSTQYDLDDGELVIYLCDDCLVKKADIVRHVLWKQTKTAGQVRTFRELKTR